MYGKNAFGNPDGSRTDIKTILEDFIEFDKSRFLSGCISQDDLKTRIIVGAKGSGKTVYLRRMQAYLKENSSVYVNSIEQELPTTDLIIRFCQMFNERELTEKWMSLWKFAILRAVISHILQNKEWNQDVSEYDKQEILQYKEKIFPLYKVPMTIYAELRNMLSYFHTKVAFNNYALLQEWDELEIIIGRIIKKLPPIYFFIDSVDEEYSNAPVYWLRAQLGLFYRIMRILRKEVYGNKLHIVASIRNNVMATVCQSEHHTRYIAEEHVKMLKWNYSTIQNFLNIKIKKLKDCYFINLTEDKTIDSWLGIDKINNVQRKIEEPISQYVLRHTRMLPRDVVIMGNALAELKSILINSSNHDIDNINNIIRQKVFTCAKIFGNELLEICANQINNNEMPKDAARREYSEVYTSINEYTESTVNKLKDILRELKSDKLSWDEIIALEKKAESSLGFENKLCDVLWQNGGIGYIENGPNGRTEVFFDSEYPEFLLPKKRETYILRSCLLDSLEIRCLNWDKYPVIG